MLVILLVVETATGHVRLTYPHGRKYDLDFMDNVRTKPPCGMPKVDGRWKAFSAYIAYTSSCIVLMSSVF